MVPTGLSNATFGLLVAVLVAAPLAAGEGPTGEDLPESPVEGLALVAEGSPVEGLEFAPRAERAAIAGRVDALDGLRRLESWARDHWDSIAAIDYAALARLEHDAEATRGWRPPDDPELTGAVFAVDSESRYHLGLEGPRLPSRHDIVHRRLWLLGIWDPLEGELSGLTLTIRTQVFE